MSLYLLAEFCHNKRLREFFMDLLSCAVALSSDKLRPNWRMQERHELGLCPGEFGCPRGGIGRRARFRFKFPPLFSAFFPFLRTQQNYCKHCTKCIFYNHCEGFETES